MFHLRPNVTWSDGTAITAKDFVWSWQRLVDPKTVSPYASYPGNMHIENAADIALGKKAPETLGVKALDDNTTEVRLTQPTAAFLAMLGHPAMVPVDKILINRFGEKWTKPEHIVTSGAYKLSDWVVNERIVAVRNTRYWDNSATVVNKVTYLPISSETADVNRYKAGEIDITYTVPVNQFAQLKKTLGDQVNVSPLLATYYYEFNTTKAPFNDPRIRRALNMALDKDIIADKVMGQGQRPARVNQPARNRRSNLVRTGLRRPPQENGLQKRNDCLMKPGLMRRIHCRLICFITPWRPISASRLPLVLCGRKTRE